jgi:hypothetical protein
MQWTRPSHVFFFFCLLFFSPILHAPRWPVQVLVGLADQLLGHHRVVEGHLTLLLANVEPGSHEARQRGLGLIGVANSGTERDLVPNALDFGYVGHTTRPMDDRAPRSGLRLHDDEAAFLRSPLLESPEPLSTRTSAEDLIM